MILVLFFEILLVHYTIQSEIEVHAECRENVTLRCAGLETMTFMSVAWYMQINLQKPLGIIRWDQEAKKLMGYNFSRPAAFGKNYSLFLSDVKPEDSGVYECEISAGLGDKNKYPQVNLTVGVCPTQAVMTTPANALNWTQMPQLQHEKDLPVVWCVAGVMGVGLLKIILSVISILVIRALHNRSSRKWRQQW